MPSLHKQNYTRPLSLLAVVLFLLNAQVAHSQANFWSPVRNTDQTLLEQLTPAQQPLHFQTFQLDYPALAQRLQLAPMEFTPEAKNRALEIQLPLANGSFQTFRVWESPVMAPELTAKYPEIRTYAGVAADGSGTTVRLGAGYQGFHAFIFDKNGALQSVRPYAMGQKTYYMA
ncbi:MAG: hypothetical protein JNK89_08085, partial [Saprospiraceae bacterium]|nr:hypothetical protein [Saprospiraceae bacterium]